MPADYLLEQISPEYSYDSSLKFQTRSVSCFADKIGYAIGSIEGRVAVEYFDPEMRSKKYAFKCHRMTTTDGMELIHPVNSISFHPTFNSMATAGSDGIVNIWDTSAKKRLCQLHRYPTSISSISFNQDGSKLAIAASYLFEEGQKDHPPDSIYIRNMSATECKLKS